MALRTTTISALAPPSWLILKGVSFAWYAALANKNDSVWGTRTMSRVLGDLRQLGYVVRDIEAATA